MPRRDHQRQLTRDPALAGFEAILCVLMRLYWRCILEPLFALDASRPRAERRASLVRIIRALLFNEARITRLIHRLAARLAGLPSAPRPLRSYMRPIPSGPSACLQRIRDLGALIEHPLRYARRLAGRIRRALRPLTSWRRFQSAAPVQTVFTIEDAAAASACAHPLIRSRSGGALPLRPNVHAIQTRALQGLLARAPPHVQDFLHTKSGPPETAH